MHLTIEFTRMFLFGIYLAAPVILLLLVCIILLGQFIGCKEQWTKIDALYYSLITATTVGYGDYKPGSKSGKLLSIVIAFLGLILTGIIVALAVKAGSVAFHEIYTFQ